MTSEDPVRRSRHCVEKSHIQLLDPRRLLVLVIAQIHRVIWAFRPIKAHPEHRQRASRHCPRFVSLASASSGVRIA